MDLLLSTAHTHESTVAVTKAKSLERGGCCTAADVLLCAAFEALGDLWVSVVLRGIRGIPKAKPIDPFFTLDI